MSTQRSPWEFRGRALISFAIYFAGFSAGYSLDYALGGRGTPTYVLVGLHWGDAETRICAAIAALFAVAGFLLRWWGSSYHQAGVVFSGQLEARELTASGPYRYTRNPLYLGNLLQAVGISSVGPPAAMGIILILLTAFLYRLILLEEAYLASAMGEPYERYCAAVPRMFPTFRTKLPEAHQPAHVLQGLLTELGALGFAVWIAYLPVANPRGPTAVFGTLFYCAILLLILGAVINRRMSPTAQARKEGT